MKLSEARKNKEFFINSIDIDSNEELGIRLMHLGFLENEPISVVNKTPISHDALLVNIKGTQIALTKYEASLILIREA